MLLLRQLTHTSSWLPQWLGLNTEPQGLAALVRPVVPAHSSWPGWVPWPRSWGHTQADHTWLFSQQILYPGLRNICTADLTRNIVIMLCEETSWMFLKKSPASTNCLNTLFPTGSAIPSVSCYGRWVFITLFHNDILLTHLLHWLRTAVSSIFALQDVTYIRNMRKDDCNTTEIHTVSLGIWVRLSLPRRDQWAILLKLIRWSSTVRSNPKMSCPTTMSGSILCILANRKPSNARSVSDFSTLVRLRAMASFRSHGHGTSKGCVIAASIGTNY